MEKQIAIISFGTKGSGLYIAKISKNDIEKIGGGGRKIDLVGRDNNTLMLPTLSNEMIERMIQSVDHYMEKISQHNIDKIFITIAPSIYNFSNFEDLLSVLQKKYSDKTLIVPIDKQEEYRLLALSSSFMLKTPKNDKCLVVDYGQSTVSFIEFVNENEEKISPNIISAKDIDFYPAQLTQKLKKEARKEDVNIWNFVQDIEKMINTNIKEDKDVKYIFFSGGLAKNMIWRQSNVEDQNILHADKDDFEKLKNIIIYYINEKTDFVDISEQLGLVSPADQMVAMLFFNILIKKYPNAQIYFTGANSRHGIAVSFRNKYIL